MSDAAELKTAWETAEQHLVDLGNEYDEKRQALKDKYSPKILKANEKAVAAQKAYCDAMATDALLDRPDGETIARALGLELPTA